jgi:hypothetical protein
VAGSQTPVIVASIVAGSVSALSVLTVAVNGWRERTHDRAVRREERQQERLERTYTGLIEYTGEQIERLATACALVNSPRTWPPVDEVEVLRIRAMVMLHGSAEVRRLLQEFLDVVQELRVAAARLPTLDAAQSRMDESNGFPSLEARDRGGPSGRVAHSGSLWERGRAGDPLPAVLLARDRLSVRAGAPPGATTNGIGCGT